MFSLFCGEVRAQEDEAAECQERYQHNSSTAINQGEDSKSARYTILWVVAAFPLDVNFESASPTVHRALGEDRNALAGLFRGALST